MSGNLIWHRFLNSDPYSIISLPDSGFILPSTAATKLDALGNVQYAVYQNYPNYANQIGYLGFKTSDGYIVGGGGTLSGFQYKDAVVCKRDLNGYADCYNVLTPNAFSVTSGINLTNFSLADSSLVFTENPISYVVYDSIPLVAQLCPGNTIAENNSDASDLKLFPNPFENYFSIESSKKINSIKMTDLAGRVCFQQDLNQNEFTFKEMKGLVPGIYIVRIKCSNEIIYRKLIKQPN